MYTKKETFFSFYKICRESFGDAFVELKGSNNPFQWPKGSGVYVIWEVNPNEHENLLYIGMTGKFSRNNNEKVLFNGKKFKARISRWTPYRFCESEKDGKYQFSFRFGPKYSNVNKQGNHMYDLDAYRHFIPYSKLHIHFFVINANHPSFSPAALESLLLTKYLKEFGDLPPANNSL